MSGNTFGQLFTLTSFGESHGPAIGGVVDGCPPGLSLSEADLQLDLDRRKPGTSKFVTQRKEDDEIEILSGIFEGKTTGAPIGLIIRNKDQRSQDYSKIKETFRPGHADFTYQQKYGIRDYRGGGRSSARETAVRVAAGAIAKKWLKEHPEKTEEIIPEIELDLNRLQQISRRFRKMGSEPEMGWIDLSQNVDRVIGYLKKRLPSLGKSVQLKNDISSEVPIFANGSLLAWSIENIIRNGIDAIEGDEGLITVSLIKENNRVHIQIKDNGCGIPKKDWKNVFRPGFSSKKTGWGLGLSLTQRIIEDIHGGQLKVLDSSVGLGTTFEISFPDQK